VSEHDAHGVTCPPETWLFAVAAEIRRGHVYVASGAVTPLLANQERR
jgi:hypothetical protein